MSVKWKILIPAILMSGLLMAVLLIASIFLFSENVDSEIAASLNTASYGITKQIDSLKDEARIAALYFAADYEITRAAERADAEELVRRANQLDMATGLDFCVFTDEAGAIIAQTQESGGFGDYVVNMQSVRAALSGIPYAAVEVGTAVQMSACSSAPIFNEHGELLGVVITGFRLDTESFVDSQKRTFDVEVTMLKGDVRIATTLLEENGTRAV